ncbi:MAG: hypothetical protein ABH824_05240 [Nanoarchaeota archaeon]|nr:hypothetical protein [Nanoarchaeota archaeon]MBU1632811.1 hypothetical protein [Nanoarchaeota archaeon]MBU1876496.1 hypothetical protein [Nanoarchaeota archaeon]
MLEKIIDFLFQRKPTYVPENTSEKDLVNTVGKGLKEKQSKLLDTFNLMMQQKWDPFDISNSIVALRLLEKKHDLPKEVYQLVEHAVEYGSLEPYPYHLFKIPVGDHEKKQNSFSQLETLLEGISILESVDNPPRWVYTDLWDKWHGNNDKANSDFFASDVKISANKLINASDMPRKARNFFLKVMDNFVPDYEVSYGIRAGRLAENISLATEETYSGSYSYCNALFEIFPETPPEVYGAFLSLPQNVPDKFDTFIIKLLKLLPEQAKKYHYLKKIEEVTTEVVGLLRNGHNPAVVGQLFGNCDFEADGAMRALYVRGQLLAKIKKEVPINQITNKFVGLISMLEHVNYNVDPIIFHLASKLPDPEQEHFNWHIDNLRGYTNSIDLIIFADALYDYMVGKQLSHLQEKDFATFLSRSMRSGTKKRKERQEIESVLKSNLESLQDCPEHVKEYYGSLFPQIMVQNKMLDVGEDNGAWYLDQEAVSAFLKAKTNHDSKDGNFLNEVVNKLIMGGLLDNRKQRNIVTVNLACGSAYSELRFGEILGSKRNGFDVQSLLIDNNAPMLESAALNCQISRKKASLLKKDIRYLSYEGDVLPYFQPQDRQLILTLFGRTFFNLELTAEVVIERIFEIAERHSRNSKSPTIVLLEGDKEKNMKYYRDPGSEQMHLVYLANRLDVRKENFFVRNESTYAALLTPDKSKVEFYFLITEDVPMVKTALNSFWLRSGRVIRIGESRTVQPSLRDYFERKGFQYGEVNNKYDEVMVVLTPDTGKFLTVKDTQPLRLNNYKGGVKLK